MAHERDRMVPAMLLMIASALSFTLMGAAVKYAEGVPVFEKVLFRNLVILFFALSSLLRRRVFLFGNRESRKKLLLRSLLGYFGVALSFYAIGHLPLADANILNKTSPFFVVLFAALFLRERLRKVHIPALAAAMTGALLIIRPGFDFQAFPAFLGLLSAVCAGGAYTLVRALNAREDPMVIIFYFSAFSVIVSIPLSIPGFVIPDPPLLAALLATGLFGAAGQYFITMSYRYGRAADVSIFNYSSVVFSLLIGFAGWGELPDLLSILGSVIIIAAALAVYFSGRKNSRRDQLR